LVSLGDHVSAPVTARGHASRVRVSVAFGQLMAICTASAVGAKIEVTALLARVAATHLAAVAHFAAGVASQVVAAYLVKMAVVPCTLFLLMEWHENQWMVSFASVGTVLVVTLLGGKVGSGNVLRELMLSSTVLSATFAHVEVAVGVIAPVVPITCMEARLAQVAEQVLALGNLTSRCVSGEVSILKDKQVLFVAVQIGEALAR